MVITQKDIDLLTRHIEFALKYEVDYDLFDELEAPMTPVFLLRILIIFFPLGFDEYRCVEKDYDLSTIYGIDWNTHFDKESL